MVGLIGSVGAIGLIVPLSLIILRLFLWNWLGITADSVSYILRVLILFSHNNHARGALALLLNIGSESGVAGVAEGVLIVVGVVTLLDEVQLLPGGAALQHHRRPEQGSLRVPKALVQR